MNASTSVDSPLVIVATDGSCLRNPGGPSGWAWYVDEDNWAAGGFTVGTDQQAELTAVLSALRGIPLNVNLRIETDSEYALKSCTKWIAGWKKKNWKKADGSPVSNLDLMVDLDIAMEARTGTIEIVWVRGHNGHPGNEAADRITGEAARAVSGKRKVITGPGWSGLKKTTKTDDGFNLPAPKPSSRTARPVSRPKLDDENTLFDNLDYDDKPKPLLGDTPPRTRLKSSLPTCQVCGVPFNAFTGKCACK
jgi:ribonuclease HI